MTSNENDELPSIPIRDILEQFTDKELRKEFVYHDKNYNHILSKVTKNSAMLGIFTEYLFGLVNSEEKRKIEQLGGGFLTSAVYRLTYEAELLRREDEACQQ